MHIFISHSSKDADEAYKICDLLEKNGLECFIAPRDIRLGKQYAEELVRGIDDSEAMVLLLSQEANCSPHVLREVERAVSKSIPILVYKLEEFTLSKSMEYFLMAHQWVNSKPEEDYHEVLEFVRSLRDKTESGYPTRVQNTNKYIVNAKFRKVTFVLLCMLLVAGVAAFGGYYFAMNRNQKEVNKQKNEKVASAEADNSQERMIPEIKVGDTITFGSYNGEPIDWRVLRVEDAEQKAVLISKNILTMKAFDAAESGKFNHDGTTDYWMPDTAADTDMELQAYVRGNNEWYGSNIRTWLNSAAEVVGYEDQAPAVTAMAEITNGYNNEPGFLHDFTEAERAALCETEIITKGNVLTEQDYICSMDRVFLLSLEELQWFDEAGISKLAVPTEVAVEQDESNWYEIEKDSYGTDEYYWWLREPVEGTSAKCYLVGTGYYEENLYEKVVGLEGFGIRPAVMVDMESLSALLNYDKVDSDK